MKFANKLFLAMTALLTIMFALFGIWMLASDFSQLLNKEIEQGNQENNMFQFLFEMGYQSTEEFGEEYAVSRTLNSISGSVERGGSRMFVVSEDGTWLYGSDYLENMGLAQEVAALTAALDNSNTYGYCIRKIHDSYYMLTSAVVDLSSGNLYLGMCRNLTAIYNDRQNLLSRYRIALVCLLLAGGICIYIMSQYITRPIRSLDKLAGRIADGDFALRSHNEARDEIGELARNFNRMADRLVEQMQKKVLEAKQKEDFTAAFAHELKTPLTAIIGYADLLRSRKLDEEKHFLSANYIYTEGKRLENMSFRLLDIIVTKRDTIERQPMAAKALFDYLKSMFAGNTEQKLRILFGTGTVYAEGNLLKSVLLNLVDNACKASSEGGLVEVYGKRREGAYAFCVRDYGVGIPEEELKKVTEAFYMVDKSRSRSRNGAGLGLALCVEILRLHDSELIIESKVGEGTTISFEIPDRQEGEPDREGESSRREEREQKGESGQTEESRQKKEGIRREERERKEEKGQRAQEGESKGGINEVEKDNGGKERDNNGAEQDELKEVGQA